jgi:cell division control protein 6
MDKLKDPEILNILSRVKESGYLKKNVCIIGITNDIKFDTKLDAKTRSVLSESTIIFPPYDANQLRDILNQRADLAFRSGVLEDTVIPLCAAYAAQEHGDARRALKLLKISGEIAEERGEVQVLEKHVKAALNRIEKDKVSELIHTLPRQSKLVLASCIICDFTVQKTYTGEIYNQYQECCKKVSMDILSQNRVVSSLSELNDIGLINAVTISKGRYGRMKEVSLAIQAKLGWSALMDDNNFNDLEEVRVTKGRQMLTTQKVLPLIPVR